MRKALRGGITRSQRRRRRRRMAYAYGVYFATGKRHAPYKRNLRRAADRHPPTECKECGIELAWVPEFGRYEPLEWAYGNGEDRRCPSGEPWHLPLNGRRPHRYWDSRSTGASR